jgi:UPF0176 protein
MTIDKDDQKQPNKVAVLSFYSFVNIDEPDLLLPKILLIAKKKYVKGTVLIAEEGFNGSICGDEESVRLVVDHITNYTGAKDVNAKINYCNSPPFSRIKVKIKPEIVAMRLGKLDVENLKGKYIQTHEWDEFISRDDVVVIDTRNDYEIGVGTFKNSIDPKTETFGQFPSWAQNNPELFDGKKVAMFCTGGIRCEKSTAYMKSLGHKEVYHLNGGILQYLEDTGNVNNLWQGDCFVFDDRGAVSEDLSPSSGYWVEKGRCARSIKSTIAKTG